MNLRARLTLWLSGALLAGAVAAPSAQAVLVHTAKGHFISIAPARSVSRHARSPARTAARASAQAATAAGTLTWHGGPILHSSAPYLIFWTPPRQTIPAATESLLERFFTDVAAGSGTPNVYAVTRQYTDASGFADYHQTFSASSQTLTDTGPYPARDAANCPDVAGSHPTCITDAQIQAELSREIAAARLPADGAGTASSLPSKAPIYFLVLPSDVSVCFADGDIACATTDFCAYHSSYVDARGDNVVYATIPTWTVGPAGDPKDCQTDATDAVQEPNGSAADAVLKYVNHEDTESLTDPTGYGWWDDVSGNEEADNCNAYGPASPAGGTSPNAFAPALGGSASAGTLFDQIIGHDYYLQSEWSNGDGACEMTPSKASLTPSFTVPTGPSPTRASLSFNPAATGAAAGVSSATWNFGDGSVAFRRAGSATATVAHAYATSGTYTVTLRLVDQRGNLATTTRRVTVYAKPTARFTAGAATEGIATAFDASASSDTDAGVTIASYAWSFGDGQTATGPTPTHTYAKRGTYAVALKVTNRVGLTSSVTRSLVVGDEPPTAAFAILTGAPASGHATNFDAAASADRDGRIIGYAWNFGDGAKGAGPAAAHVYRAGGTYTATLTVTDSDGQHATVSHAVIVGTTSRLVTVSAPPSPATVPTAYTVTPTVTDRWGQRDSTRRAVTVDAEALGPMQTIVLRPVQAIASRRVSALFIGGFVAALPAA